MSNPFENTGATAPTKSKKAASFDVTAHNSAHKPPADPMLAASGGTQSVIPIRKPGKKFFRVHPDPAFHAYGVLALVACRGESVTAVATPKGQKQVYAWRVPAIWTDLLPESHTNDLSATGH
jgi:hypothetical protein